MTKSELISNLAADINNLPGRDVELAIKCILEQMSMALESGERIEIRGFGSFSLHFRPPRMGRNPKTGASVALDGKHVPHFKPGKNLRERVNKSFQQSHAGVIANSVEQHDVESSQTSTKSMPRPRPRGRVRSSARVRQ